jgi:hypothetical protein
MLRRIDIEELREWRAFAELEPFGPRRDDARAAQTSWMLAELHRDKKKRRRPFDLDDFVLDHGDDKPKKRRKRKTWKQMRAIGAMLARAAGAKVPAKVPESKDDKAASIERASGYDDDDE